MKKSEKFLCAAVADLTRDGKRSFTEGVGGVGNVGMIAAGKTDTAERVANFAAGGADGRGDGLQTELIFLVFYGVSLISNAGKLREELLVGEERARRMELQRRISQNAACLCLCAECEKELSL